MGTLCSIDSGSSNAQDAVDDAPYALFDRSKKIKRSMRYLFDCEALIIPGEGTEFLPRHFIGKFDLHQRAYALHSFSERIDVRYLYYYLIYLKGYWPRVAVGATVKSLRRRHFENLPVTVAPRDEQQRIVAILDEAFAGLATSTANAEKNLKNVRELFDSYLSSIFADEGDGRVRRTLSDLCKEMTVGHVGPMATRYKSTGTPFLRSQNVRPFEINLDEVVFIDDEFHRLLAKSRLRPGDVAIVRTAILGLLLSSLKH